MVCRIRLYGESIKIPNYPYLALNLIINFLGLVISAKFVVFSLSLADLLFNFSNMHFTLSKYCLWVIS